MDRSDASSKFVSTLTALKMASELAVSARLKELQEVCDLKIADCTDATVEIAVTALLSKYLEYKFSGGRPMLTPIVQKIISKQIESKTQPSKPAVASLNQVISGSYNKNGSKRTRPAEDMPVVDSEEKPIVEESKSDSSEKFTDEPGAVPIKSEKSSAPSTALKKRKTTPATRGSDHIDSINPLLGNPGGNFFTQRPKTRLTDLAGIDSILRQIQELVFYPIKHPVLYSHLGVSPPCGILLNGPSGCGKTMLASAIAGELGLPFYKASGPELVGGTSGESEERIRQIFESAASNAPSVLFIDAIDVIAGKKDSSQRGMERRIVAQLFDSIDYISSLGNNSSNNPDSVTDTSSSLTAGAGTSATIANAIIGNINNENSQSAIDVVSAPVVSAAPKLVILIAATNKPEAIDPGVRGRFSREVSLPVPDAPARSKILQLMTSHMRLSPSVDFKALGKLTPGFVGADLQSLTREAGMLAVSRIVQQGLLEDSVPGPTAVVAGVAESESSMDIATDGSAATNVNAFRATTAVVPAAHASMPAFLGACVEMDDFAKAAKSIQPTAKREGFAVAPDVTWSDVGALAKVREELLHNVLEPISHPERFRHLGLDVPAGVLFFGPPGCGKTLLAKALANQSGANFISVKGPELLSMYVGESESKVRQVFARARASAPCVIFFDELDALCPKRGSGPEGMSGAGGGNGVSDRVVNQLLTELDGLETRRDVYIIAATNRLELIDDAMLRPGRLGKLLYVPLPTEDDRKSILQAITKKVSITWSTTDSQGVDLERVAHDPRASGFSGADLAALVREAGLAVVREIVDATKNRAVSHSGTGGAITSEDIIGRPYVSTADLTALAETDKGTSSGASANTGTAEARAKDDEEKQTILARHFEAAFHKVRASVSERDRERYELVNANILEGMGAIQALNKAAETLSKRRK